MSSKNYNESSSRHDLDVLIMLQLYLCNTDCDAFQILREVGAELIVSV